MAKRNYWPMGVTTFIISFLLLTVAMVAFMMNQRVELVTDNAYEKGQRYDERMAVLRRSAALLEKPAIRYVPESRSCSITFPASPASMHPSGTVRFFRPSDARRDFMRPLALDAGGRQSIGMNHDARGLWSVQVNWSVNDSTYTVEERIFVE